MVDLKAMSDSELKLFITLVGIAAAVVGACVAAAVQAVKFFWLERRMQFSKRASGFRMLVLMAEALRAAAASGLIDPAEVKMELVTSYTDVIILSDKGAFDLLRRMLRLRADIASVRLQANGSMLARLKDQAESLSEECIAMLEAHMGKFRRRVFLVSKQ